jgi:uncharacterized repeat protein (TIGR01451 family)
LGSPGFCAAPDGEWWNTDYKFREKITIRAGSSAVPAGYSVCFRVDHYGLVSAGASLASGDDIRIVYWNGSSWEELDRVNEGAWNALVLDAQLWFKTKAEIPANGTDDNYYMYYGNSSAGSPPANPENVYLFYEDFEDIAVGTFPAGWEKKFDTADVSVQDDNFYPSGGSKSLKFDEKGAVGHTYAYITSLGQLSDFVFEAAMYVVRSGPPDVGLVLRGQDTFGSTGSFNIMDCYLYNTWSDGTPSNGTALYKFKNGNWSPSLIQGTANINTSFWHRLKAIVCGWKIKCFVSDTQYIPSSGWYELDVGDQDYSSGYVGLKSHHDGTQTTWFDNVKVRKYVDPEPVCDRLFVVTNTEDTGIGTLRDAIETANSNAQPARIIFHIPNTDANYSSATGTWKINPTSALPGITQDYVFIDGSSQTTFGEKLGYVLNANGPEIELTGTGAGEINGLSIQADNCTVKELVINDFDASGIDISGSYNTIIGCYIGVDVTGSSAKGNGDDIVPGNDGIYIHDGANNNTIGGADSSERNIISGNSSAGVRIQDANSNTIIGNYIGLARNGSTIVGNGDDGVSIGGTSQYNTVGGTASGERNVVSGNETGITFWGGASNNKVIGNYVGTDAAGMSACGNTNGGVIITASSSNTIGGSTEAERNVISGNINNAGVYLFNSASDNVIQGNYIGVAVDGVTALENGGYGGMKIWDSWNNKVEGNVIAHNNGYGIKVSGSTATGNLITKNSIFSNSNIGIYLYNGGNTGLARPVITSLVNTAGNNYDVSGTANANATVEIFSDEGDPSGYGEGKTYLATASADGSGNFNASIVLDEPTLVVTATQTDASNNTSEFSAIFGRSYIEVAKESKNITRNTPYSETSQGVQNDVVEFKITLTNTSKFDATNVVFSDTIPSALEFYIDGYGTGKGIKLNTTLLTNASGDDAGEYDDGLAKITVNVGTISAGSASIIYFKTKIK